MCRMRERCELIVLGNTAAVITQMHEVLPLKLRLENYALLIHAKHSDFVIPTHVKHL